MSKNKKKKEKQTKCIIEEAKQTKRIIDFTKINKKKSEEKNKLKVNAAKNDELEILDAIRITIIILLRSRYSFQLQI